MSVVIIIPVYKEIPTLNEKKSLNQCFKILYKYHTIFVASKNLDITYYKEACKESNLEFNIERFDSEYFRSISGYSKLLLSKSFYERFSMYKFMLIYQLDCWVFRDELEFWCEKNFDFIGAPLVGRFEDNEFSNEMIVGNGGLSLRKIQTYIKTFSHTGNLLPLKEINLRYDVFNRKKFWKRIPLMCLMWLGYRNHFEYFNKIYSGNEDNFWTIFLKNTPLELYLPDVETAICFSFERFPSKLFEINEGQLPFGCHAWEKYEYDSFWFKYIQ